MLLRVMMVLIGLAMGAPVTAQTVQTPTFYMWGDYPVETGQPYNTWTNKVRRMVHFNLNSGFSGGPAGYQYYRDHPETLAVHIADQVHAEISASPARLAPTEILVIIQNLGYDSGLCDAAPGQPELPLGGARFFLDSDRLPGIGEFSNSADPKFPEPRNPIAYNDRENFDAGFARSYRHPFLANGKDGAPLRAWFVRLVDRLDQEFSTRQGNPNTAIPHPNTYRYYMDIEPLFIADSDVNGVWFFDYLANPAAYGHPSYNYWNPSDPNSPYRVPELAPGQGMRTLQQCYEDYKTANGFTSWPTNPSADLGSNNLNYYDVKNAPYVTFYGELCNKVRDAVLDRCFHSVLREKWPNSGVRSGNYSDFTTDGVDDVFGWTVDRPWAGSIFASNQNPPAWTPSESSSRHTQHKARGGARYYLYADANGPDSRRLLDYVSRSSGTTDSPVCYPIHSYELDGLPNEPGHRHVNLYDASQAMETGVQTSIRFHRQTSEAILNTPGTGTNNAARDLAPWMIMPLANNDDDVSIDQFVSRENARNLLAMFRAKNIKEAMFWTKWYITASNDSDPPRWYSIEQLHDAWDQTQRTVTEVYSTRVKKYTRVWHTNATNPVYEDTGESAEQKASRLEFTLRQNPQTPRSEREVRLNSKAMPVVCCNTPEEYQTSMTVDFDWIDTTYVGPYDSNSNSYPESRTKAEVNVECSIEFSGVYSEYVPGAAEFGQVEVWSQGQNQYVKMRQLSGYDTYVYTAPKSEDGRWRMRMQFIADGVSGYIFPDSTAANAPRTRLRLIQKSTVPFKVRYDLVQVIPTNELYSSFIQSRSANSDMNHDGVVDETDLSVYLDEWMSGSPAADFDADSAVTGDDADAFVEAYVAGT